jgi:NodT family efflux transporter outer membrane factor (OMF) lipoprotein
MKVSLSYRVFVLAYAINLAACSLAPDYQVPSVSIPAVYKEAGDWLPAQPADGAPRGLWWHVFNDPELNALEEKVTTANQNLKIAFAQYQQAHDTARAARSAYFPLVTGTAQASRQKSSGNLANTPSVRTSNDFLLQGDLSYEVDLWGRVRNLVAANEAEAQASAADLASIDLSLHAELASDYFTLRGDDTQQMILDLTVQDDQADFDLTRDRYRGGVVSELDVNQAETQLETAKTQAEDMRLQRAQLEHAIAILTGAAPADFSLAAHPLDTVQPKPVALNLPSTLLERRPDIAAAERRAAAANAEIGIARAAWFPSLNIGAALGLESASLSNLVSAPSSLWALGPSSALTILDAGRIDALSDEARAAYDQSAASYRETVLEALQDVEDNLAAMRQLEHEQQSQSNASAAAKRALKNAEDLYKGGATTYIDVVVAENATLQAQISLANIQTRYTVAQVQLIKALGGGWQASDLKDRD